LALEHFPEKWEPVFRSGSALDIGLKSFLSGAVIPPRREGLQGSLFGKMEPRFAPTAILEGMGNYRLLRDNFLQEDREPVQDEKNAMFSGTAKRHYKIGRSNIAAFQLRNHRRADFAPSPI
jgi:hypothetical protein